MLFSSFLVQKSTKTQWKSFLKGYRDTLVNSLVLVLLVHPSPVRAAKREMELQVSVDRGSSRQERGRPSSQLLLTQDFVAPSGCHCFCLWDSLPETVSEDSQSYHGNLCSHHNIFLLQVSNPCSESTAIPRKFLPSPHPSQGPGGYTHCPALPRETEVMTTS